MELKERFGDLEIDTIIGKNHKGAIPVSYTHLSPSIGVNDFIQGKALNGLTDEWTCHPLPVKAYPGLVVEVV